MEPMNGIYVVSRIKEINPDAICLMVTGFPNGDVRRFAAEGGVDDLITKPIQAADLKESLRLALNKTRGATEKLSGIALTNRMDKCPALAEQFSTIASEMQIIALSDESLEEALDQGQIDDAFYFKVTMDQVQLPSHGSA